MWQAKVEQRHNNKVGTCEDELGLNDEEAVFCVG